MATTSQILTWAELQCHGWNREGARGTRAILNEVHRMLLTKETEQNILYDDTTGDLPYLETTAGQYLYTLPANVWRTGGVLINRDVALGYEQTLNDDNWRFEDYTLSGVRYIRILNIRQTDATPSSAATVRFAAVDPGDTTELYQRLSWRLPTEITSDNVQHEMPGATDSEFLLPGIVTWIQAIDNGKYQEGRAYIEQVLKPAFYAQEDAGEQGVSLYCTKRAF